MELEEKMRSYKKRRELFNHSDSLNIIHNFLDEKEKQTKEHRDLKTEIDSILILKNDLEAQIIEKKKNQ